MSSPPVGPVTGVPPVNAAGSAVRLEILAATGAALDGMMEGATAEAPTSAKAGPAGAPASTNETPAAPQPPNPVAQAVDVARASAAQRQGSLAPLFADLAQALDAPALPPALRTAIVQVLALQTPLSGPLTAETVRQAVARSGLFLEAHLAQAPVSAPAAPDLKGALLTLQTALAAVPAPRTLPPTPTVGAAAPPAPAAGPLPGPTPAEPSPTPTNAIPTALPGVRLPPPPSPVTATDSRSALLSLQIAPPAEATAETPMAPPASPEAPAPPGARLSNPPALLAPILAEPDFAAPPQSRGDMRGYRTDPPDQHLASSAPSPDRPPQPSVNADAPAALRPPPPHRAAALTAQPALEPSLPVDAKAPVIVEHLQDAVEQAVARQTLHQVASLPDGQTTAWMFELPLATPQGTAIAQFEIQRDGRGQHGGEEAADGWRLRFSIDVEPLGPVHVHLGLNGDHAQVVVWAERETSLEWLRTGAADLSRALPAEVVFHPGAPRRPTPSPGQFVDQAL